MLCIGLQLGWTLCTCVLFRSTYRTLSELHCRYTYVTACIDSMTTVANRRLTGTPEQVQCAPHSTRPDALFSL